MDKHTSNLQGEIMNIPTHDSDIDKTLGQNFEVGSNESERYRMRFAYKLGHRDARHSAAEIAAKADARVAALESALAAEKEKARRLREFAEEVDEWPKAYHEAIFPAPTPEQVDMVCDRLGFRIDNIAAMILRHFAGPWGKKAREVLKETE